MGRKVQHATICFLVRDDRVLLGMKKRGLGVGWWNGMGGKLDNNESILESAKREILEEIEVEALNLTKVAELHFDFIDQDSEMDWVGHAYIVHKWSGEPKETEEMKPKWFKKDSIPFRQMWDGDHLWIPRILKGEKIRAKMSFNKDNKLVKHEIEVVEEF